MNRKVPLVPIAAIAALVLVFATACSGGGDTIINSSTTTLSGINVNGTGRVSAAPDTVFVTLGVTVEQPTVAQARDSAAGSMQAVIDSLKSNGVDDKDIQTTQFTITPVYDYTNRAQTLRGYQVTNVVTARITKVDTAGKAIDGAAAAGGNAVVIRSINFTIDQQDELQAQARELAIKQAKERAEQLARNAGVDLGPLQSISEYVQIPVPQYEGLAVPRTGGADISTPIQTGELEVIVNVSLLYAIQN